MQSSVAMVKKENVKEAIRKTLKQNGLCCCSKDGSFKCNNCRLVENLREKTDHCCPNCYMKVSW